MDDYNEQLIGTIDFVMNFDKDIVPDRDVEELLHEISTSLNEKYKELAIHFDIAKYENSKWFELNGLVQMAHDRRNASLHPMHILKGYLTQGELHKYSVLAQQISAEASNERS